MAKYLIALILCSCALLTSAQAALVNLSSDLNCSLANAGSGTCGAGGTGTGNAAMTLDTGTNDFNWNISWTGLSGNIVNAHFHGPASPNANAGVEEGIDFSSNPAFGSATLTATQASDLLSGLWYINLHTDIFPAGEIRGQVEVNVVPVPAAVWLFGTGILGLIGFSKRRKAA
jgi:hypothetical protein